MVAIVTGNGLGLAGASSSVLGGGGQLGSLAFGQAGERVVVNARSGNLVIQRQDEILCGQGLDIGAVRTYNSGATFDFDNNDGWQISLYKKLGNLTGTVNTVGSTLRWQGGDGAQLAYVYDSVVEKYLCKEGGGAYDTLAYNSASNSWILTDGETQETETYGAGTVAGEWRITGQTDLGGSQLSYSYNATTSLIDKVTDANGEVTQLSYDAANKRLLSIQVTIQGVVNGVVVQTTNTRVHYTYDGNGRLSVVTTDLSPSDGSVADGNVYTTTYTYDGSSARVASITNSDGSKVSFTYDSSSRIKSVIDGAGKTTSFTYNVGCTAVTDPSGQTSTLTYDAKGNLTRLQGPTGGGQDVGYVYNSDGDLTKLIDSRGNAIAYSYDGNGNLTRQQDAAGNVIERAYSVTNQLLKETVYAVADPDGDGIGQASVPQTTYYVRDGKQRLRFTISPQGRVSENRYNPQGQVTANLVFATGIFTVGSSMPLEKDLISWVASLDKTGLQRTDTTYDARGLVSSVTRFAKTDSAGEGVTDGTQSITRYIYDCAGRLLQQIDPRGVATTGVANDYMTAYVYDALGRVLSVTQYDAAGSAVGSGATRQTRTTYNDGKSRVEFTLANGLQRLSTFDARGLLLTQVEQNGDVVLAMHSCQYDVDGRLRIVIDANGNKTYTLYDTAGRQVGAIDAVGSLSETVYDNAGLATKTIRYANAVTADLSSLFAVDANGMVANNVALSSVRPSASTGDQITRAIYDDAGRLRFSVDGRGYVRETRYDGAGRILATIAYANVLNNPAGLDSLGREAEAGDIRLLAALPSDGQIALQTDSANDRVSRNFYDNDGLLRGTLDSEGYLTEFRYDNANRLTVTIRYASVTSESDRAAGALSTLASSANLAPSSNVLSFLYYDGLGQLIGERDGLGYYTAYQYDLAGNRVRTTRYANNLKGTALSGTPPQIVDTAPEVAPSGGYVLTDAKDQVSQVAWTAFGQRESETAIDGTLTKYTYDTVGNQLSVIVAQGAADSRTSQSRYDKQGHLTQELAAYGSLVLAALGATPTQAQVDAVWAAYGTSYSYDAIGRRVKSVDANGNIILFFYDKANRLTYSVRRIRNPADTSQWLGEVSARQYNSLGQLVAEISYANRITSANFAKLSGGAQDQVKAVIAADAANDTRTDYDYFSTGEMSSRTVKLNATEKAVTTLIRNAFGEISARQTSLDASRTRREEYIFDRRGLVLEDKLDVVWDSNIAATGATASYSYDAFGRLVGRVDERGVSYTTTYDKLGREIKVVSAAGDLDISRSTTYDAFSRTLSQTDALGNKTNFAYSIDNTTGQRTATVTTPEGIVSKVVTDRYGQTLTVVDGLGNETRYAYDANGNRLTSKRWDKAANVETVLESNTYDSAAHLLLKSQDANGNIVVYTYDAIERLLSRTLDPDGLKLVTTYAYDAKGQQVSVTDPSGTLTQTSYDLAGRIVRVAIDPDGLNLRTQYVYDLVSNQISVVQGYGTTEARTTQYSYDSRNRRVLSVLDPAGLKLTTSYSYDQNDNLVTQIEAAGTGMARTTRYSYDAANRLVYTVDALGSVIKNDYDAEGRVIQKRAYAKAVDLSLLTWNPSVAEIGALLGDSPLDRVSRLAYDKNGRLRFSINALGAVTETQYDKNGNLVKTIAYANAISSTYAVGALPTVGDGATDVIKNAADRIVTCTYDAFNRMKSRTDGYGTSVARTESWGYDKVGNVVRHRDAGGGSEWFAYDQANRQTRHIDQLGFVTDTAWFANGRIKSEKRWMNAVALPSTADDLWAYSGHASNPSPNDQASSGDRTTTYAYDQAARVKSSTDALGMVTRYVYDSLGNLTDSTIAADTAVAVTTHRTYDLTGRVLSEALAYGTSETSVTKFAYDALGNQIAVTIADGTAIAHSTTQAFDLVGRKTGVTDGNNATTTTSYNAFGDIVKVLDANGNAGYFFTDALGRVTLRVDPEGAVTETRYDLLGNVTDTICYANRVVGVVDEKHRPQIVKNAVNGTYVIAGSPIGATYSFNADVFSDVFSSVVESDNGDGTWRWKFGDATSLMRIKNLPNPGANMPLTVSIRVKVVAGSTSSFMVDFGDVTPINIASELGKGDWVTITKTLTCNGTESFFDFPSDGKQSGLVLDIGSITFAYPSSDTVTQKDSAGVNNDQRQQAIYDVLGQKKEIRTWFGPKATDYYSEKFTYNANGNVVAAQARNGACTSFEYDKLGRKTREILPITSRNAKNEDVAVESRYIYDAQGNLIKKTEAYGLPEQRITSFGYDKANRQIREEGQSLTTYDPVSGKDVVVVPVQQKIFDIRGNLVEEVDAKGNRTIHYYDALGRETGRIDAAGAYTTWGYDAAGNKISEKRYANPVRVVGSGAVPSNRLPTVVTSPPEASSAVVTCKADAFTDIFGAVTKTDNKDGTWRWTFGTAKSLMRKKNLPASGVGLPVSVSMRVRVVSGSTSTFLVDLSDGANANIASELGTGDWVTITRTFSNKTNGNFNTGDGNFFDFPSDGYQNGLVLDVDTVSFAYDAPYVLEDAANDRLTQYVYDGVGRQVGTRNDDVTIGLYDSGLNGGSYQIGNGSVTTAALYDSTGNLIKSIDGNGNVTRFFYNKAGQRIGQLDAKGYLTVWQYDAFGNAIKQTQYANPVSLSLAVTDSCGLDSVLANVSASDDDRITNIVYDQINRKTQESRSNVAIGKVDATNGSLTEAKQSATTTYSYDGLNNIVKTTDAVGAITRWDYDAQGRKIRETRHSLPDYQGKTVVPVTDYVYDGLGNMTWNFLRGADDTVASDDRVTSYVYGTGGYLLSETDASGAVTQYRIDANGNVTRKELLNRGDADGSTAISDVTLYQYDALNRQVKSTDVSSSTTQECRYDLFGALTGKRTNAGGSDAGWQEFAQYDRLGRAWKSNAGDGVTKVYLFDAAGNATLSVTSAGSDLSGMDLATVLGLSDTIRTVSVFDARNQLADTYEAPLNQGQQPALMQANAVNQATSLSNNLAITIGAINNVIDNSLGNLDPIIAGSVGIAPRQSSVALNISGGGTNWITYMEGWNPYWQGSPEYYWCLNLGGFSDLGALGSGAVKVTLTWSVGSGDYKNVVSSSDYFLQGGAGLTCYNDKNKYADTVTVAVAKCIDGFSYVPVAQKTYQLDTYGQSQGARIEKNLALPFTITPSVVFSGQPTPVKNMLIAYRSVGSSGGYTWAKVPLLDNGSSDGVAGRFAFAWSAEGITGGKYEFQYFALDAGGSVVNQQSGTLDLTDSTSPKVTQNSGAMGPIGGAGRGLVDSSGYLNLMELGDAATSCTVKYRLKGSSGAWSSVTASKDTRGAGWFGVKLADCFAKGSSYDLEITAYNGSAVVSKGTADLARDAAGNATISSLVPDNARPAVVHLFERSDTSYVKVSYRAKGSAASYTTVKLAQGSAGAFDWDASGLVADRTASYEYEVVIKAFGSGDQLNNETQTVLRLGANAAVLATSSQNSPLLLRVVPSQAGAASIKLKYRLRGSDSYAELATTLVNGEFRADFSRLGQPASGRADYEVSYDVFDAKGALLGSNSCIFSLQSAAESQRILKWSIAGLGSAAGIVHRSQRTNAFGEVTRQVDGLGRVTDLAYNTLGLLVSSQAPETKVTLGNGFVQRVRPTTRYLYDLIGRRVAMVDPNGGISTQVWLNGGSDDQIVLERHADGGVAYYAYDIFGDRRLSLDVLGNMTETAYDQMGRVVEVKHQARAAATPGNLGTQSVRAIDSYRYDAAGHRITHTNALGDIEKIYYDSLGRVTRSKDAAGFATSYSYVYSNAILGLSGRRIGGWETTTTDAVGRTQIDRTDVFGRTTWHQDLGGHSFQYVFDNAGRQIGQSASTGQNIQTDYYTNGQVKSIWDKVTGAYTSYRYDAAGNRNFEGVIYLKVPTDLGGGVRDYYQTASLEYDELNRLTRIVDPGTEISYEYDAAGNRRHMLSSYRDGVSGKASVQDYWYAYDAMNRFTVTMGSLSSSARGTSASDSQVSIVKGTSGVAIAYDLAGNRRQASNGADGTVEDYSYSADGYLENVKIGGVLRSQRNVDLLGRLVSYNEWDATGKQTYTRTSSYDKAGRVLSQSGTDGDSSNYYYTTAADDASTASQSGGGELAKSAVTSSGTTVSSYYSYDYWDSAQQRAVTAQGWNAALKGNNNYWLPGHAYLQYDVNGRIQSATDVGSDGKLGTADDRNLSYVNDAAGHILRRDETVGSNVQRSERYFYANDLQVGDVGDDGPSRTDYAQALAARAAGQGSNATRKEVASADFDQNYEPIGVNTAGAGPSGYTVRSGDTLQSIARAVWGDASLWYLIADANALSGNDPLASGAVLTLPNKVSNIHNTASTFRPYSPGETMGDTSPTLPTAPPPPKPKKKGCGGASIIVAIVAVVATIVTAGAALTVIAPELAATAAGSFGGLMAVGSAALGGSLGMAGFGAALIGGAVGSIAGQLTGMALGVQDKFSWGAVAAGALTAAAGGAASGAFGGGIAGAVAANVATQGINLLTGQQKSFSWSSVAASAISAPITQSISGSLTSGNGAFASSDALTKVAVVSTTAALVSATTRVVIQGGRVSWEAVAADALSSTMRGMFDSGSSSGNSAQDGQASGGSGNGLNLRNGEGIQVDLQGNTIPISYCSPNYTLDGGGMRLATQMGDPRTVGVADANSGATKVLVDGNGDHYSIDSLPPLSGFDDLVASLRQSGGGASLDAVDPSSPITTMLDLSQAEKVAVGPGAVMQSMFTRALGIQGAQILVTPNDGPKLPIKEEFPGIPLDDGRKNVLSFPNMSDLFGKDSNILSQPGIRLQFPAISIFEALTPQSIKDFILEKSPSEILGENLRKAGIFPASSTDRPHHIVPYAEGRDWAKSAADEARALLALAGIDRNDAENGVWTPKDTHSSLHNRDYYESLVRDLRYVRGDKQGTAAVLRDIGNRILDKTYPGVRK